MRLEPADRDWLRPRRIAAYMKHEDDDSAGGRYNGGQRLFFFAAALGALGLRLSGVIMCALERCGASTVTAASATAALAILMRETPDVLLADIAMPEADGYELLRSPEHLHRAADDASPIRLTSSYSRAYCAPATSKMAPGSIGPIPV